MAETCDALIVGGGFYGLYLAAFLAKRHSRILLVERGADLMTRASYANQARVHGGYHYPRSVLTAGRSRANYSRFLDEFHDAISDRFEAIYAIARVGSQVTAEQFTIAMERIGAPLQRAELKVRSLFDSSRIEDVFLVEEAAFDADRLRRIMAERVAAAGVSVKLHTTANRATPLPQGGVRVETSGGAIEAGEVYVCGYAQTNAIAAASGLPMIPLKHELAEMALIEVPEPLKSLGITVMDGPFFSCMPFPPRGLHTLSHVRYTPHGQWFDNAEVPYQTADRVLEVVEKRSAFPHMMRDAARFVPSLASCEQSGSLWEVKTLLPRSEADDSRPILFRANHGLEGLHVVMGGKIDNVYDVADAIEQAMVSQ